MKTLLFAFLCCMPVLAFAQHKTSMETTSIIKLTKPLASPSKMVVDTVFPAIFGDECSLQLGSAQISDEVPGYVIGSNGFGDLAKLQRLVYESDEPYMVTEVFVAFAAFDETIADTYVSVSIFENTNADGSFGNFIANSDSVRVGDLALPTATNVQFSSFKFSQTAILNQDTFLVAVNLDGTYTAEEDGYLGIFHTLDGCGSGNNSLEFFRTNTGGIAFDSIANVWNTPDGPLNVEIALAAAVNTDVTSGSYQPVANYKASISPNPAQDMVTIRFQANQTGRYAGTLTDLNGRSVRHSVLHTGPGQQEFDWETSSLSAGLYLYHIDGPVGRQSGKLMVH